MMTNITLTAGAILFIGTIAKPAARTATDWNKPAAIRVPTWISSMALTVSATHVSTYGVPMSNTIKVTKSMAVKMQTTISKNQVVVDGKR